MTLGNGPLAVAAENPFLLKQSYNLILHYTTDLFHLYAGTVVHFEWFNYYTTSLA